MTQAEKNLWKAFEVNRLLKEFKNLSVTASNETLEVGTKQHSGLATLSFDHKERFTVGAEGAWHCHIDIDQCAPRS